MEVIQLMHIIIYKQKVQYMKIVIRIVVLKNHIHIKMFHVNYYVIMDNKNKEYMQ